MIVPLTLPSKIECFQFYNQYQPQKCSNVRIKFITKCSTSIGFNPLHLLTILPSYSLSCIFRRLSATPSQLYFVRFYPIPFPCLSSREQMRESGLSIVCPLVKIFTPLTSLSFPLISSTTFPLLHSARFF